MLLGGEMPVLDFRGDIQKETRGAQGFVSGLVGSEDCALLALRGSVQISKWTGGRLLYLTISVS